MISQPYWSAGNVHAALAGPADPPGRVYLDHRFFLSLDDTFLSGLGVYDQAFILVLNSRYKQEQDGMTLDG